MKDEYKRGAVRTWVALLVQDMGGALWLGVTGQVLDVGLSLLGLFPPWDPRGEKVVMFGVYS